MIPSSSTFIGIPLGSITCEGQAGQKVSAVVLSMAEKQTYIRTHIHTQVIIDVVVVAVLLVSVSLAASFFLSVLENSHRSERKMTGSETCSFLVYSVSFFLLGLSPPLSLSCSFLLCVCSMAASMCCPMKSDLLAIRRARVPCAHLLANGKIFFLKKKNKNEEAKLKTMHIVK